MQLREVLPGAVFDASPLGRVLPGTTPTQPVPVPVAVFQGVAFVPVPGAAGRDGTGAVPAIAGLTLALGQPAYVSRTDGRLYPANAGTYLSGFVVGLVTAGAPTGFQAEVRRGPVTLSDWTAATGVPALLPGQEYYLSPAGLLTTVPPVRPLAAVLVRIGTATSSSTLDVNPSPPIQL